MTKTEIQRASRAELIDHLTTCGHSHDELRRLEASQMRALAVGYAEWRSR